MNKNLFLLLILFCIILVASFLGFKQFYNHKQAMYIAVACPMTGPGSINGDEMLKGINLSLKHFYKDNLFFKAKEIKLMVLDDQNDNSVGMEVASKIVADNSILMVIGHYSSDVLEHTGGLYKRNRIPVITASATGTSITKDNGWAFRVIPNNHFQAFFIAHYINKALEKIKTNIVYSNDEYGKTLLESFKKGAAETGLEIVNELSFSPFSLKRIINRLSNIDNQEAIFLALNAHNAALVIKGLKDLGSKSCIIGPDSFSTNLFLNEIEQYSIEKGDPGFYSDGIYVLSPFITDIANEKAYFFNTEFQKEYHEKPSWVAATYYDAMSIALESIKKSDPKGNGYIRSDRSKIREALASFYNYEHSFKGITGYIYFDVNGDFNRPYSVGYYKNGQLIPALRQYTQIADDDALNHLFERALSGQIITIDKDLMTQTNIVYVGIDINEISNVDFKDEKFTIDFDIWFRSSESFDFGEVEFLNSLNPLSIWQGQLVYDAHQDNMISKVYHFKSDFKTFFDLRDYPFDEHKLSVQIRHSHLTSDKLIFVKDVENKPGEQKTKQANIKTQMPGWIIDTISFYQNIITNISSLGKSKYLNLNHIINYSQFNADIFLKRDNPFYYVKIFLPFILMVFALYPLSLLFKDQNMRVMACMAVLMSNALYHQKILSNLYTEYLLAIEYVCWSVYILIIIFMFKFTFLYTKKTG